MPNRTKKRSDEIDRRVGEKLKRKRMFLGITHAELSRALDVSVQQIRKYESADDRITSGRLYAFAKIFKVPISYFYDFEKNNVPACEKQDDIIYDFNDQKSDDSYALDKELLSLIQAFKKIKSTRKRKKILELIKEID